MNAKWMIGAFCALASILVAPQLDGHTTEAPAQQPVANGDPAARIEKIFGPTKQVEVRDPFYNNMVAFTITIPKDWAFEGTILHGPGCGGLVYQSFAYRAYSPDAAIGVQVTPRQVYYYWEQPNARPEGPGCKFFAPMSSADYAAMFAYRMRPNAHIDKSEQVIGAEQIYANIRENNERMARSAGQLRMPAEQDYGDFTRTRIHYSWEGFEEEEWLRVEMVYKDLPKSVFIYHGGAQPGHQEWRHFLETDTILVSRRSLKGKLDQYDPGLIGIIDSVQWNPQFTQATNAHQQQITNMIVHSIQTQTMINQQNSQAFMDAMTRQHEAFMANMQQQNDIRHQNAVAQMDAQTAQAHNFMAQMDARTAHTRDYQDILLDQQYYVNPQTGETSTVSGRFTHTWVNGPATSNATSVVQSPNSNFNPNGVLGYNWLELMPIHH